MRYGLLILINVEKRIICADLRYRKLNTYYKYEINDSKLYGRVIFGYIIVFLL